MLTYTPPHEQDLPQATEKPWALLLLCLAWLLPGLLWREPLKPDETLVADIVRHLLEGGGFVVPTVAGEPWLERAPLFYWVAAGFAWIGQLFGLAIHDGARLATGAFMALALWGTGLSARELIGRRHGRSAVLILIGCAGLLLTGHFLNGDLAVLAGWCWGIYALALAPRLQLRAAPLLGAAIALCGLAGSLAEPALLIVLALLLTPFQAWRFPRYGLVLLIALAISLPLVAAWPLALRQVSPGGFQQWYDAYSLGFFGGFAQLQAWHPFGFYLQLLPWFAWPAWFLAGATLWMQRDRLMQPRFQLPVLAGVLALLCMVLSNSGRSGYALLLLPPLALVGAVGLDVLRRGASAFVNWFGVMTFGLLALALWVCWFAMQFGIPARLNGRIHDLAPSFTHHFSIGALLIAIGFTAAWLWAVSRRRPMGRQAVTNWAAGITLCWGLAVVVAAGWVDARTSYRDFAAEIAPALPKTGCIASENLQPSQRAVLHYYLGVKTLRRELHPENQCNWLLRQGNVEDLTAPDGWTETWQGARPGDRNERYYLYRRDDALAKPE
ncbi:ArnT family glycosyltransferase [Chitinimonas naiadis]